MLLSTFVLSPYQDPAGHLLVAMMFVVSVTISICSDQPSGERKILMVEGTIARCHCGRFLSVFIMQNVVVSFV